MSVCVMAYHVLACCRMLHVSRRAPPHLRATVCGRLILVDNHPRMRQLGRQLAARASRPRRVAAIRRFAYVKHYMKCYLLRSSSYLNHRRTGGRACKNMLALYGSVPVKARDRHGSCSKQLESIPAKITKVVICQRISVMSLP